MSAESWFNKAGQYVDVSDHHNAIDCYDKCLAIDPNHIDALLGKGLALNRLGKSNDALIWIDKVIALRPDLAVPYSRKAMALKNIGRLDEALTSVNKALDLNPNSDLIWTEKAIVLREMQKIEDAMAAYRKAVSINVKRVNAHWGLGGLLEGQGRHEEALVCYKEAAKHQPASMFYLLVGKCLQKLGRDKEALQAFNTCVEYFEKGQPGVGLSSGNLTFIKNELKTIKELNEIAAKAEAKVKEIEAKAKATGNTENPVVKNFINQIATLQADKDKVTKSVIEKSGSSQSDKDELQRIKDEFNKKLAEMEAMMQKQMNEVKKDVTTLKKDVKELQRNFEDVKAELDTKMDNFNKKLEKTLETQDLTPEEIQKMKGYYGAFISTFSSIYVTSQVVDSGQVQLDADSSVASVLSMVASFAPFVGNILSTGVKTLGDFLQAKEMKTNAKKMKRLANDPTELSQLVGEAAYKLATDKKKQAKVLSTTEQDLEKASGNLFEKVKKICSKIGEEVDAWLYTKLYSSPSERVGHNDANMLIEKWINDEFKPYGITDQMVKLVMDDLEGNGKKDVSQTQQAPTANRTSCCTMF